MSPSSTCVVIPVRESARALVRTGDSVARQSSPAGEILLAAPAAETHTALTDSVAARLGARVVRGSGTESAQVNAAVRGSVADRVVVVPAGIRLDADFIARCSRILDEDSQTAAVVPAVRLHAPDGLARRRWRCRAATLEAAFADPRSTPPVLLIRRDLWDVLGGVDESLVGLVEYDFWLRVLAADRGVHLAEDELVLSDVSRRGFWEEQFTRAGYLVAFRAVMEKHSAALADRMAAVLIEREVSFGRLRDAHREMTLSRDQDLAELDRLRADTAHHRAYLVHHRRDGIDWGDLRRTDPTSREWGYDRGEPLDRYYIDAFLAGHSSEIRGGVLEVQEDDFTRRFGGPRVTASDVVDLDESNPRATVVADLRHATPLRDAAYDCIILTQTLHVIDDMGAVLRECHRLLKPGGVLLATMPCASRVCLEYGEEGDLWRMTPGGAGALVERVFGPGHVQCRPYGNVLANVGFLTGAAAHELRESELDILDPYFPALVGMRAAKPRSAGPQGRSHRAVVLLYHRIADGPDPLGLKIPVAAFKEQLAWLSGRCRIVALEELLETARDGFAEPTAALTFDDGYVDNLEQGIPILQGAGAQATFFVTTRWLDSPGEYWWDTLTRTSGGEDIRAMHDTFVHASLEERDRLTSQLPSPVGPPLARPMMADEILALSRVPGMTIGAHTVNHLALPDQPHEAQRREVMECAATLRTLTGQAPRLFAYPYGAVDRTSADLVRRAWAWGATCDPAAITGAFDAARVARLDVKAWPLAEFATRIDALLVGGAGTEPAVSLMP